MTALDSCNLADVTGARQGVGRKLQDSNQHVVNACQESAAENKKEPVKQNMAITMVIWTFNLITGSGPHQIINSFGCSPSISPNVI